MTPAKHEMGHKFYEKCIKNLAKKENIDYNKAKDKIDDKIFTRIKELNVNKQNRLYVGKFKQACI